MQAKRYVDRYRAGFTLFELMVVVGVVGAMLAIAIPSFGRLSETRRLKDGAIEVAALLNHARSEAIRTGHVYLVFYGTDAEAAVLKDANDYPVPFMILDDGRPGSLNQNCKIDAGETRYTLAGKPGVSAGVASGTARVSLDSNSGDISTGSSFKTPGGGAASWVLFKPQGIPVSFDSSCNLGPFGSGAGAFYLTNSERTLAVVLAAMGNASIHTWNETWSE